MVEQIARSTQMLPSYDAAATEGLWNRVWVERGYFRANVPSDRPPFCIVIPPPNVTGRLHVGHALGRTLEDALVRRARMQGYETLWVPGTDHAGIATQVVVERDLREQGIDPRAIGREAFVQRVWQWKERYGGEIVEQIKRMGASCDWSRERFTMDEGLSRAVRVAFVRMYEDDLVYRGERLVNWCPTDQTGLSDSEVEHTEVDGELVTFRYRLVDGSGHIDVATTRLETMLGDTGVAVHPDDGRYVTLVGARVRHPFDAREIPIVADPAVDPEFGTGAVKVTPAHDPNDFEIAQRTGLPLRNILAPDASLNDTVPEEFRGLDRYEARAHVRRRLGELGLLVHEERPYRHVVGRCYRCESEIEPWISGLQWFVAVDRLKGPAREAAIDGRVRFWPERWHSPYIAWLDNLRDWNISRQLWWGHRIPAWYCLDGHVTVAVEDPDACAECGSGQLEQDPDVLDTWFSSQLWPFSTLGWPDQTGELAFFYPNTVLVTGYEILYLWVARMIMSGLYLLKDVPFRHTVIHGLVRDSQGRKMSKSLGNVIDPLEMIDRYGADALRFSLARTATGGQQDIPLSERSIEAGRHFANKLWNASRLVLAGSPEGPPKPPPQLPPEDRISLPERWLLSRHAAAVADVDAALDEYRIADAAQALHRFVWSELCDWGLEVEKGRLQGDDPGAASDASAVLGWVLERTLRLLHPIMPFVTEEIWQRFGVGETIVLAHWPEQQPALVDPAAERAFGRAQEIVGEIRRLQAGLPSALGRAVELDSSLRSAIGPLLEDVRRLTGADVSFAELGDARVRLARTGDVDLGPVIAQKERSLSDVRAQLERRRAKLANEGFLTKAPREVVEGERENVSELEAAEAGLLAEIRHLRG